MKAWLGTWQVAQLCCPDAERLVSKNRAWPAATASAGLAVAGAVVPGLLLPPPQPASDTARTTIEIEERIVVLPCPRAGCETSNENGIANHSHLQKHQAGA